jgi:hypothetical protein
MPESVTSFEDLGFINPGSLEEGNVFDIDFINDGTLVMHQRAYILSPEHEWYIGEDKGRIYLITRLKVR